MIILSAEYNVNYENRNSGKDNEYLLHSGWQAKTPLIFFSCIPSLIKSNVSVIFHAVTSLELDFKHLRLFNSRLKWKRKFVLL